MKSVSASSAMPFRRLRARQGVREQHRLFTLRHASLPPRRGCHRGWLPLPLHCCAP